MPSEPSAPSRILVVDDEPLICEEIDEYLTSHGFRVSTAPNGAAARNLLKRDRNFDLVLTDLTMPGEDGLSLTRFIHNECEIPVIIVTARAESVDRILGLEIGADDYVVKPFNFRELVARINVVLRRHRAEGRGAKVRETSHAVFEGWELNLGSRELKSPEGKQVDLTSAEFKLLAAFVKRPKRVLRRDFLLILVHGREWNPLDRSIDNLVVQLRRKIDPDLSNPRMIKSARGEGYLFGVEVKYE